MPSGNTGGHMFEEWQATATGSEKTEPVSVPGTPAGLAGSEAVRYKTRFPDPRDGDDDVAVLELRGLYAHAELEVTGDRVDGEGPVEHDAYFAPLGVPFVPYEDNELVVTCHAPRDRFGGLHDTDLVPEEGRVPGIWWDATLSSAPLPYIEDVAVRPELTGDGARLRVRTTVVADEALSERITYSVKPAGDSRRAGMMERATVETDGPGRTTVEHEITVRDPALWWPRGLGEQNRYTLRAKLDDSELSVTTGICDVGFEDGHLVVNDEPLPVRGVNLLTADPADVERALELNATLVRAHAHVLPPACYELCDREGLLVWQDMPLTGPGGFDADRGARLADLLTREYSRPALADLAGRVRRHGCRGNRRGAPRRPAGLSRRRRARRRRRRRIVLSRVGLRRCRRHRRPARPVPGRRRRGVRCRGARRRRRHRRRRVRPRQTRPPGERVRRVRGLPGRGAPDRHRAPPAGRSRCNRVRTPGHGPCRHGRLRPRRHAEGRR
ncbi:hypothetical protein BRC65_06160 [Halobacteriales archaeon QH_2_65_14]|nr:MAG: hypothetical protein BRC65_06160 [Halobacteriales archaeon QH_2_65_14]